MSIVDDLGPIISYLHFVVKLFFQSRHVPPKTCQIDQQKRHYFVYLPDNRSGITKSRSGEACPIHSNIIYKLSQNSEVLFLEQTISISDYH